VSTQQVLGIPHTVSKIQFVRPEYPDPFSDSIATIATKGIKLPIKSNQRIWDLKHFVQDRRLIQVDEIFNKSPHQNRLWQFVRLAVPATLALGSDFWRMSAIGLLAGLRIINFKKRWEMWKKYVKHCKTILTQSIHHTMLQERCFRNIFGCFCKSCCADRYLGRCRGGCVQC